MKPGLGWGNRCRIGRRRKVGDRVVGNRGVIASWRVRYLDSLHERVESIIRVSAFPPGSYRRLVGAHARRAGNF